MIEQSPDRIGGASRALARTRRLLASASSLVPSGFTPRASTGLANAAPGKLILSALVGAGLCLAATLPAAAQVSSYGDKQMGEVAVDQPSPLLKKVYVHQRLNQQIPLDQTFRDETGATVKLGDYFGRRPVILAIVYYACPMLCSEELNGLTGALEMVKFRPGKDFDIVAVSIDPSETPQLAASKKAEYVKRYAHPETAAGWHFLTGQQPAIDALAQAVGFGYARVPGPDGRLTQFAHASAIQILTPEGRLAQYYMGVEYSPKDLQLGLVEASHHQIGSPVDNILTYCYRYDPDLNKHSLVVARVVQLGGVVTMLCLGGFMVVNFRRDLREADGWQQRSGNRGNRRV